MIASLNLKAPLGFSVLWSVTMSDRPVVAIGQVTTVNDQSSGLWSLVVLGSMIVVCVAGGLAVGVLFDGHFDSAPVWSITGIGLGMVCACWISVVRIRKFLK